MRVKGVFSLPWKNMGLCPYMNILNRCNLQSKIRNRWDSYFQFLLINNVFYEQDLVITFLVSLFHVVFSAFIPLRAKRVGEFIEIRHKKILPTRILNTLECLWLCHSVTLWPINSVIKSINLYMMSSLHWLISLSFLYVFIHWRVLHQIELSVSDVASSSTILPEVPISACRQSERSLTGPLHQNVIRDIVLLCSVKFLKSQTFPLPCP